MFTQLFEIEKNIHNYMNLYIVSFIINVSMYNIICIIHIEYSKSVINKVIFKEISTGKYNLASMGKLVVFKNKILVYDNNYIQLMLT